jgi:GTP-binding protein
MSEYKNARDISEEDIKLEPLSEEALSEGERFFKGESSFVLGVVKFEQLPQDSLPEIAFAGRSNVGKSSLLNALMNRKNLARTSNTPGRTREVNFFKINDKAYLVDLPGYGYAKAPKKEVLGWNKLIMDYLQGRSNLSRICLLIDSRHGIKNNDEEIMKVLDSAAVNYNIVLTKTDKINAKELENIKNDVANKLRNHPACNPRVIATSSAKGFGLNELRAELCLVINL